jgi:hypothetical protein
MLEEASKMPNRNSGTTDAPATVHCWSADVPNKTFVSLDKALAYCKKNIDELPAIEVFLHCGQVPEPIISGQELEALLKRKRRSIS